MNKISKIVRLLKKEYGTPQFDSYKNPLDELILTILSQNTTWQNCRSAFDSLKKRFKGWRQVAAADTRRIAVAIRCGGLSNVKAERIKELLNEVYRGRKSFNLRFLPQMKEAEALSFLSSFKGVGPKTAACVLLFSCRKPVLPVDTHILRVSKRLGLIEGNVDLVKAHRLLGSLIPKNREKVLSFHINMIQHGRQVCKAQNSRCANCVLKSTCDYWKGRASKSSGKGPSSTLMSTQFTERSERKLYVRIKPLTFSASLIIWWKMLRVKFRHKTYVALSDSISFVFI